MNGVICIDKPSGMTSFSVVSVLKGLSHERRAGHTGTLDPMATGVLPVFFGEATKAIPLLPCKDKRYTAGLRLGVTTDTGDITGKVLGFGAADFPFAEVEAAVQSFCGEIEQVPPMYSALKKDGRRLYEIAREGGSVEREPRRVTIYGIAVAGRDAATGDYILDVRCSKGTYIRTLCEDIGKKLGCGGTMSSLRRTFASGFDIGCCKTLDEARESAKKDGLDRIVLDIEKVFEEFPKVNVTKKQALRFRNGGELSFDRLEKEPSGELCRILCAGVFIGIGRADTRKRRITVGCHFNRDASLCGGEVI